MVKINNISGYTNKRAYYIYKSLIFDWQHNYRSKQIQYLKVSHNGTADTLWFVFLNKK